MERPLGEPWLPLSRIEEFVQLEPALVILGLALGSWLGYRVLLRGISQERHLLLQKLFRNLAGHLLIASVLYAGFSALHWVDSGSGAVVRVTSYVGLLTLLWGLMVFVKACRILVFEYLFLSHMRVAVPLLLVNLCTLLLSLGLAGWLSAELFGLQLTPLLATSAIFSLVLGLALQDTLGNLFAGVALQLDKPYEIGDWIEIQNGTQKWVGQVREISWRATLLTGMSDESITVPNRTMAQAQISNFSSGGGPIARSQVYRVPHDADIPAAKLALAQAATRNPAVLNAPAPLVLVAETTDSWAALKLVYFIHDYGSQFLVADQINEGAIEALRRAGIALAHNAVVVLNRS